MDGPIISLISILGKVGIGLLFKCRKIAKLRLSCDSYCTTVTTTVTTIFTTTVTTAVTTTSTTVSTTTITTVNIITNL